MLYLREESSLWEQIKGCKLYPSASFHIPGFFEFDPSLWEYINIESWSLFPSGFP